MACQMSQYNLSKGPNQISSWCTHQIRHRCSRFAAACGVRRYPGSTGSLCSRPVQQCRPTPAPCGLWAERMAALWAAPKLSGSGNTGGNWGPTLCTHPPLGLKKTKNINKRLEGLKRVVKFDIQQRKLCEEIEIKISFFFPNWPCVDNLFLTGHIHSISLWVSLLYFFSWIISWLLLYSDTSTAWVPLWILIFCTETARLPVVYRSI